MEIKAATLDQVTQARNGRWVLVSNDLGNVARDLLALDSSLRLRQSESTGHYVVYQEFIKVDGSVEHHIVTTSQTCDQRLVHRVAEVMHPDYDLEKEAAKVEAEALKKEDDEFNEWIGDQGERLAHAMRKDLGVEKDSARSRKAWGKGIVGH